MWWPPSLRRLWLCRITALRPAPTTQHRLLLRLRAARSPQALSQSPFLSVSQTAVYIFVCVNNLKYEGFALLLPPLDNINYRREPSSLEKKGEKKTFWKSCRPCKYLKGHLHLLQTVKTNASNSSTYLFSRHHGNIFAPVSAKN